MKFISLKRLNRKNTKRRKLMLKQTVALGSLLTLMATSATLAHGNFRSGFLAGAHVGYSFGSGKFNSTSKLGPAVGAVFVSPSSDISSSANKSGPLFGIFVGYRHLLNQSFTFGLNLEANVFGSNEFRKQLDHTFTNILGASVARSYINRMKKTFNVIPSVAIGKIFCDHYHVSFGLGLAIARFKQQVERPSILTLRSTQTKIGVVPSLGVEYAATKNVSIYGSLSYEIYSKISKLYDTNVASTGSTYTSSMKPRYATLKVGASYRF